MRLVIEPAVRPPPDQARRPGGRRRRRPLALAVGLVFGVGAAGALGVFGWQAARTASVPAAAAPLAKALRGLLANDILSVRQILVAGRQRTDKAALLAAIGARTGDPILHLDLGAVHDRIAALAWVGRVEIERRLPDTLFVRIVEREPLAIWQHNRILALIDARGAVIPGIDAGPFAALPLVIGEDARLYAADFLRLLGREPALRKRVRAITRVGKRRWDVRLDNRVDIQLPEHEPLAAWSELARMERDDGLLGRDVVVVDMRVEGRLVIRVEPGTASRLRDPGRQT